MISPSQSRPRPGHRPRWWRFRHCPTRTLAIIVLPETARRVLGAWADLIWSVRATCTTVLSIGPNLRLLVPRLDMREAVPADPAT